MPTGYTHPVQTGEITEFRDFAMRCARAMGACIMMRDEPLDAPIPERGEPNTDYYDKALATAHDRLAALRAMGPAEAERAATDAHREAVREHEARAIERREQRARYEAMMAHVLAWEPPTHDHGGLKTFMLEQLETSIRHDTSSDYDKQPVAVAATEWLREQIRQAEWDINYHTEKRGEEIARTARRNKWIAALRHSLESSR